MQEAVKPQKRLKVVRAQTNGTVCLYIWFGTPKSQELF